MCRIEDCERHELWGGFCKPHLKEAKAFYEAGVKNAESLSKPKRKSRKAKVDAVEVLTTDATEVAEERSEEE